MNPNAKKYLSTVTQPYRPSQPTINPWKVTGCDIDTVKAKYEAELEKYDIELEAWKADVKRASDLFRHDALEDVGLLGHPKEKKAWDYASGFDHDGNESIYWALVGIAEVILD